MQKDTQLPSKAWHPLPVQRQPPTAALGDGLFPLLGLLGLIGQSGTGRQQAVEKGCRELRKKRGNSQTLAPDLWPPIPLLPSNMGWQRGVSPTSIWQPQA